LAATLALVVVVVVIVIVVVVVLVVVVVVVGGGDVDTGTSGVKKIFLLTPFSTVPSPFFPM